MKNGKNRGLYIDILKNKSAVFGSSATAAMPIGSLIISMLVAHISLTYILIGSAVVAALILVIIIVMRPDLGKKEESLSAT